MVLFFAKINGYYFLQNYNDELTQCVVFGVERLVRAAITHRRVAVSCQEPLPISS